MIEVLCNFLILYKFSVLHKKAYDSALSVFKTCAVKQPDLVKDRLEIIYTKYCSFMEEIQSQQDLEPIRDGFKRLQNFFHYIGDTEMEGLCVMRLGELQEKQKKINFAIVESLQKNGIFKVDAAIQVTFIAGKNDYINVKLEERQQYVTLVKK